MSGGDQTSEQDRRAKRPESHGKTDEACGGRAHLSGEVSYREREEHSGEEHAAQRELQGIGARRVSQRHRRCGKERRPERGGEKRADKNHGLFGRRLLFAPDLIGHDEYDG